MTDRQTFYALTSLTMDPCSEDQEERERSEATWLCVGCASAKPGVTRVDVKIQEQVPDNTPLNMISGMDIGVAHREFLFAFGERLVQRDLFVGRLIQPDGVPFSDWVTFRGRRRVIVRGSKNAVFRICDLCGNVVYAASGK